MVEFSSDLVIIRPKDANRGNGSALVEISNRGGRGMLRFYDHARGDDELGDGFLMRNGFTLVWVGWEFDVANGFKLHAPVATDNGSAISGWIRSDFVFPAKTFDASLGHRGQRAKMAVDPESTDYKLTVRDSVLGERQLLPRGDWQFGRLVDGVFEGLPIHLPEDGIQSQAASMKSCIAHQTRPSLVSRLAAVRDLVSCFKYEKNDVAAVSRAIGFGISQSGRFLRHFLYQGFNADERDRAVFDGIDAHVAGGGHGSFNHRFAEPSRDASPFSTFFYPTDIFPFTDVEQTDPETGETDGLLTLTAAQKVLPKIFYTNSSYEYWGRAASLMHPTLMGRRMHSRQRSHLLLSGGQHGLGQFRQSGTSRAIWCAVEYAGRACPRGSTCGSGGAAGRYPRMPMDTDATEQPQLSEDSRAFLPISIERGESTIAGVQIKGLIAYEPPTVTVSGDGSAVDRDGIDLGGADARSRGTAGDLHRLESAGSKNGAPDQLMISRALPAIAKTKSDRDRLNDPRPDRRAVYEP
jgi:hypothetical protein